MVKKVNAKKLCTAVLVIALCIPGTSRALQSWYGKSAGVSAAATCALAIGSWYCFDQAKKIAANPSDERSQAVYKNLGKALAAGACGTGAYCGYSIYEYYHSGPLDPENFPDTIPGTVVTLQKLTADSTADYHAMFSDDVRRNLEFPENVTYDYVKKYVEDEADKVDHGRMIAYNIWDNQTNQMVGSLQIRDGKNQLETVGQLGMWLNEQYRGGNRIQEALYLLSRAYFDANPQAHEYGSFVRPWNNRSRRAHEKFGFVQGETVVTGDEVEYNTFTISRDVITRETRLRETRLRETRLRETRLPEGTNP